MCAAKILIACFCCSTSLASPGTERFKDTQISPEETDITISLVGTSTTKNCLRLTYKVINSSDEEVWICDNMLVGGYDFETFLTEDGQTLVIRRRCVLDIREKGALRNPPLCHYVRLGPGVERQEIALLPLPWCPDQTIWASGFVPPNVKSVTRALLEIGYCLPERLGTFRGTPSSNAEQRRTNEEFFTYDHDLPDNSEHVLRLAVENLHIPCGDEWSKAECPDLNGCTSIEFTWYPSALEYFFPHADQQSLLSSSELDHLGSMKMTRVDDRKYIEDFTRILGEGDHCGVAMTTSRAHAVCFRDGKRMMSFHIFGDIVVTKSQEPLLYPDLWGGGIPNLTWSTPEIHSIELRVQCKNNLDDLGSRIRSYAAKEGAYPPADKWCDEIVRYYRNRWIEAFIQKPFQCPSAKEGRCHYAMNPNCGPDTPADMVLLFETSPGWNQHGGPEIFSFDNHDPKGGCVQLNDGTVRFIHTEEELNQLHWK